jgi:penicillin-binding protein A
LAWLIAGLVVLHAEPGSGKAPASPAPPTTRARVPEPPAARARSSLDPELQALARRLLAAARPVLGGLVAVHAPSGRILASQEYHRAGHGGHPLTQAITPAASLFKIVTTVALLERSPVRPGSRVCIDGGQHAIGRTHLTPPRPGSKVSCRPFGEALGFSRNAVFSQLATEHLLHRDLLAVAERLGFNRPLPFDTKAEMGTLVVPYNDLEFARTAVGFRGSKLSVLGAARLAHLIANGGSAPRLTLHADDAARDADAGAPVMQESTARRLRGMLEVTTHSGTSVDAFSDPDGKSYLGAIRVAGKTGTLQPASAEATASWFIGFAPSRKPEIVVSVMLENGAVWRRKAKEVARDFLRAYFQDRPGVIALER